MKTNSSRIKEIDILYSIGAVLAVFGHSHPNNWSLFEGTFFYHSIVFIYTFHMALFFFIAGVLLSVSKGIETKPFGVFIKEKALKLLTPYFVLSILAIIPKGYLEYGNFNFLSINFIIKTIFNPRNNIWGHFWFLPVLFIGYLVFGLLKKIISKANNTYQVFVLSVCVIVFGILLLYPPFNCDWFGMNDVFKFSFYMPLGMLLTHLNKKRTVKDYSPRHFLIPLCAILLLAAAIICYILFYNVAFARFVISVLMIFCLLSVAFLLKNTGEKIFGFFSKNIFTIYIYSWPFQSALLVILERIGISWQICAPVMFVAGIICPLALMKIYKRFKKLNCRFFNLVLGIR